jgi:MFS family permease
MTLAVADVPGALVSAAAALVAALFAAALLRRWAARGRRDRALLYWGAALTMFCLAALGLASGELAGWSPFWFRIYYLFGGVLTVPWLAMGVVEAASRDPFTLRVLGVTAVLVAAAFAVAIVTSQTPALFVAGVVVAGLWGLVLLTGDPEPVRAGSTAIIGVFSGLAAFAVLFGVLAGPIPAGVLPEGNEHFEPWVRSFAVGGNAIGAVLVVVGAVTSALRLRGRQLPHVQVGNLLIALGVLVATSGGTFAFLGETEGHAIAFAIGVTVMYAGFVRATGPALAGPSSAGVLVEVHTREGCGLCDTAERLAQEEAGDGAEVVLIDIDEDPDLQRRYNIRVPVVAVDGEEVAEGRIAPGTIRRAVAEARRQRVR